MNLGVSTNLATLGEKMKSTMLISMANFLVLKASNRVDLTFRLRF